MIIRLSHLFRVVTRTVSEKTQIGLNGFAVSVATNDEGHATNWLDLKMLHLHPSIQMRHRLHICS